MAAIGILAFVMLSAGVCTGQFSDCSYYGLLEHLNLTSSNVALEMMRPVKNWTTTTTVDLEVILYGILGVDEKSQTVTTHIWYSMLWTNEFLNWNPSNLCGINEVSIARAKLWIPEIVVQQDASDSGSIHKDPWVVLLSNGSTFTFTRQRLTFTCSFNLYHFPFDIQHCNISFVSMSIDENSLILRSPKDDLFLMNMSEMYMVTQGEWGLKNMEFVQDHVTNGQRYHSTLVFIVTLERRPVLYVVNFIIPLVYLLVLDLASFSISVDSGEKFGFKVTVLLSISVLLLILKDILPSTEVDLPIIANLCVAVFTLVWLSVLESMLVSFLHKLDDCFDNESRSCSAAKVYFKKRTMVDKEVEGENGQVKPEQSVFPLGRLGDVDVLKLILEEVKATRQETGGHRKPGCYRRAAAIIDNFFFIVYLLTFVAFVTYICVGWIEI